MYLIDTSSIISLFRYYDPLNGNGLLRQHIEEQFNSRRWLILKRVGKELQKFKTMNNASKVRFIDQYRFLYAINQDNPEPNVDKSMHRRIDQKWVSDSGMQRLSTMGKNPQTAYPFAKMEYIEGADFQLIMRARDSGETIVSEEQPRSNDGKLFKKIPAICGIENIQCMTLPELLIKESPVRVELTNTN